MDVFLTVSMLRALAEDVGKWLYAEVLVRLGKISANTTTLILLVFPML
jgi:hypothetical protein